MTWLLLYLVGECIWGSISHANSWHSQHASTLSEYMTQLVCACRPYGMLATAMLGTMALATAMLATAVLVTTFRATLLAVLQLHPYEAWLSVLSDDCWRLQCENDTIVHTSGKMGSMKPSRTMLMHCIGKSALWPLRSSCRRCLLARLCLTAQ